MFSGISGIASQAGVCVMGDIAPDSGAIAGDIHIATELGEEIITFWEEPAIFTDNEVVTMSAGASSSLGSKISYQWYRNTLNSNEGGTLIEGETGATLTINNTGTEIYYCYCVAISATGVAAVSRAILGAQLFSVWGGGGSHTVPYKSPAPYQFSVNLLVSFDASGMQYGEFSYHWYENSTNSNSGGRSFGDTRRSFVTMFSKLRPGTYYYYCVATNDILGSVASDTFTVIISAGE